MRSITAKACRRASGSSAAGARRVADLAASLAQVGQEGVARDHEKPGAHVRAGLKLRVIGQRLRKRLLQEVLAGRDLARQADAETAKIGHLRH
jgi:hypothetical protein